MHVLFSTCTLIVVSILPEFRRKYIGSMLLNRYVDKIAYCKEYENVTRISLLSKAKLLAFYVKVNILYAQ